MATIIGNSIINDESLILQLDAKNKLSATSDISTWYDLSGNQNATLTNIGYNSNGYYSFDTTSDAYLNKTNFQIINNLQAMTVQFLFRYTLPLPMDGSYKRIIHNGADGGGYGWGIMLSNADGRLRYEVKGQDSIRNYTFSNTYLVTNTWYFITCIFTRQSTHLFVNSNKDKDLYFDYVGDVINDDPYLVIGRYGASTSSTYKLTGDISSILIYNRVLSDNEIMRNYRTFENRF